MSQLFRYSSLSSFKIEGINAIEAHECPGGKEYLQSNIGIVLNNGSRMYMCIDAKRMILNELVNLPDTSTILGMAKGKSFGNPTIYPVEPPSIRLLSFNLQSPVYACMVRISRRVITLLMTRVAHHQETVQVVNVK